MYANSGSPKKPRTMCGRRCSRRSRAVTTAFICSGPFGAARATPSALTLFHTHSSEFQLGGVGGQAEQPQRPGRGPDEVVDGLGPVHRVAVDDAEHRPL